MYINYDFFLFLALYNCVLMNLWIICNSKANKNSIISLKYMVCYIKGEMQANSSWQWDPETNIKTQKEWYGL